MSVLRASAPESGHSGFGQSPSFRIAGNERLLLAHLAYWHPAHIRSHGMRAGPDDSHHAVPAIYAWPQYAAVGGLMSYGTNISDAWWQTGIYTGRILKGEKPADLPVQQATKIELVINLKSGLVINLKSAKTLGLNVPLSVLGVAACNHRRRGPISSPIIGPNSVRPDALLGSDYMRLDPDWMRPPCAHRYSIVTFLFSMYPVSPRPNRKLARFSRS